MRLIDPRDMVRMPGLRVPRDFYCILKDPAPLAGMAFPSWPPIWDRLLAAGFRHVVCLTHNSFPYDPAPLGRLLAIELTDLIGNRLPARARDEAMRIEAAAGAAVRRLAAGEGVIVHCAAGTGRTGTVLGCVLRSFGYSGRQVIDYLDTVNKARGNEGWPESGWQAAMVEEFRG